MNKKRLGIIAMTGDQQARWPMESWVAGPFVLGRGYSSFGPMSIWKQIDRGRDLYTVNGFDTSYIFSRLDIVILQHWPHHSVIEALHGSGCKVGIWLNAMSVETEPVWNILREPIRQALLQFPLLGVDGQPCITWPGSIAVDFRNKTVPTALCGTVDYVISANYPRFARPDFVFVDELTDFWYTTAANKPTITQDEWLTGAGRMMNALCGQLPIWGHNPFFEFPMVRGRVMEHSTRGLGEMTGGNMVRRVQSYIQAFRGSVTTMRLGLGWERQDDPGPQVCREVDREMFDADVSFQVARTGRSFQIFDPLLEG